MNKQEAIQQAEKLQAEINEAMATGDYTLLEQMRNNNKERSRDYGQHVRRS